MDREAGSSVEIFNPEDLAHALAHLELKPGDECPGCHRPIPKKKSDDQPGPRRSVVSIHEPAGEEGTINQLIIAVIDKYQEQWPRDYAEMRANIGLELVGGRSYKFHAVHFALYAVLMVPGLEPSE